MEVAFQRFEDLVFPYFWLNYFPCPRSLESKGLSQELLAECWRLLGHLRKYEKNPNKPRTSQWQESQRGDATVLPEPALHRGWGGPCAWSRLRGRRALGLVGSPSVPKPQVALGLLISPLHGAFVHLSQGDLNVETAVRQKPHPLAPALQPLGSTLQSCPSPLSGGSLNTSLRPLKLGRSDLGKQR